MPAFLFCIEREIFGEVRWTVEGNRVILHHPVAGLQVFHPSLFMLSTGLTHASATLDKRLFFRRHRHLGPFSQGFIGPAVGGQQLGLNTGELATTVKAVGKMLIIEKTLIALKAHGLAHRAHSMLTLINGST